MLWFAYEAKLQCRETKLVPTPFARCTFVRLSRGSKGELGFSLVSALRNNLAHPNVSVPKQFTILRRRENGI